MAKRVLCFPIDMMLLALLYTSIPALADNVDLASAQPDFSRPAALSFSELNTNARTFIFGLSENGTFEERFTSEFCSFCGQPEGLRYSPVELFGFNHINGGNFPDFNANGWNGSYRKEHSHSVPEPSSLTLLGAGVLGAAFSLKKRLRA